MKKSIIVPNFVKSGRRLPKEATAQVVRGSDARIADGLVGSKDLIMDLVAVLGRLADVDILDHVIRFRIKADRTTWRIDLRFQHGLAQGVLVRDFSAKLLERIPDDLRADVTRNRVHRRNAVVKLAVIDDE